MAVIPRSSGRRTVQTTQRIIQFRCYLQVEIIQDSPHSAERRRLPPVPGSRSPDVAASDKRLSGSNEHKDTSMGNKNKTISFRVSQEKFETLRDIAEERDISLSAVFRDYVDMLVAHDGQVEVVAEHEVGESESTTELPAQGRGTQELRPRARAPRTRGRPPARTTEEHKRYVTKLRQKLDESDDDEDVVQLEDPRRRRRRRNLLPHRQLRRRLTELWPADSVLPSIPGRLASGALSPRRLPVRPLPPAPRPLPASGIESSRKFRTSPG